MRGSNESRADRPPAPWIRASAAAMVCVVAMIAAQGCTPTSPRAMDVVLSNDLLDDNVFARNPNWHRMVETGQSPNACSFCPCENESPVAWSALANCTQQPLHTNNSAECFGHWNWFPVEYEGTVSWSGHSNSVYDDDDYFFDMSLIFHFLR